MALMRALGAAPMRVAKVALRFVVARSVARVRSVLELFVFCAACALLLSSCGGPGAGSSQTERSRYVLPVALTAGARGEIYAADAGAQRIFRVDPAGGDPITLAGSGDADPTTLIVPGGYRDGPALSARFDRPSGIAVGRDGSIFVADSGNRCIRRIKDGTVSTFARGFGRPVALAFGGDGTLYVADYGARLRAVTPDGQVVDVPLSGIDPQVRSVASFVGATTTLFVASGAGLAVYFPATKRTLAFGNVNDGDDELGYPEQIVALGERAAAFADPRSRTIRTFFYGEGPLAHYYSSSLGAAAPEDAADGPLPFVAPMGIAVGSDGRLFVADAGARRVSSLPGVLPRQAATSIGDLALPASVYRIAFISNSMAYTNVSWETSIGGTLERELNAACSRSGPRKPVRVATVRLAPANMTATADYIQQILSAGNFDLVIWSLNDAHLSNEFGNLSDPSTWQPKVERMLGNVRGVLSESKTAFVIAYQPFSQESSWLEQSWGSEASLPGGANPPDWIPLREHAHDAFAASGVAFIDGFPEFWEAERSPNRVPLFGTDDGHLSHAGATLFGHILAAHVDALKPWAAAPKR
jgi:hypothetical protein